MAANSATSQSPLSFNESRQNAPASTAGAPQSSRAALWTGRVLSGFAVVFLLVDGVFKFLQTPEAVKGTVELGYPVSVLVGLGITELICLAVYLLPRTSILGAILWTGYLGGAIATHVRVGNPLFSHVLFPVYVAAFLWLGLWLREPRLRALVPLRNKP